MRKQRVSQDADFVLQKQVVGDADYDSPVNAECANQTDLEGGPTRRMNVAEWNRWTRRCVRIPSGFRAVEFSVVYRSGSYLVMHASLT